MPTIRATYNVRLKTHQTARRCGTCPPDRVCAWGCVQGAGVEDILIGYILQSEGKLSPPFPNPCLGESAPPEEPFTLGI